jgi:predicted HicB family RNase H-like nuclease
MNAMTYKGYAAMVEFDAEDRVFTGRLLGIEDIVTFHGASADDLEAAFHEAVDHYFEVSERTGGASGVARM